MARIGTFTQNAHGFSGRLHTLVIDVELCILPIQPGRGDNPPDYRIHCGSDGCGLAVGVGWSYCTVDDEPFIRILIDDPSWVEPIRAALFAAKSDTERGKNIHYLEWNHASRRRWGR